MNNKIVELLPNGNPNFGRKTRCDIAIYGRKVDQMVMQFSLPELPTDVKYKEDHFYDLLYQFELEIGGSRYLGLNAKTLQINHQLHNPNPGSTIDNKELKYYIDLKHFFKDTPEFSGINLSELDYHQVNITMAIDTIDKIIEGYDNLTLECKEALSKLSLNDLVIFVNYIGLKPEYGCIYKERKARGPYNFDDLEGGIQQTVRSLYYDKESFSFVQNLDKFKYRVGIYSGKMTKLIISSPVMNKIDGFLLTLDGIDYCEKFNPKIYKQMHNGVNLGDDTFVFNVDINCNKVDTMVVTLFLSEPMNNFEVEFITDCNTLCAYREGLFGVTKENYLK